MRRTRGKRWQRRAWKAVVVGAVLTIIASSAAGAADDGDAARDATTAPTSGVDRLDATPESVLVGNDLNATANSTCGQVVLTLTMLATPTATSRLPISVYASEPSRGLARTLVRTYNTAADLGVTAPTTPLFRSDPSGRGPGITVEMTWAGGSATALTNEYYNNCTGTFFGVSPTRMLDTRSGVGVAAAAKLAGGSVTTIDPASVAGVPTDHVTALTVNVTATEAETQGYLSVYPCGGQVPSSSSINFAASQTVANFVLVDLIGHPANGTICIFASTATHVIADVTGYLLNDQEPYPSGGKYNALTQPQRLVDTRNVATLAAGETRRVPVAGVAGVPASNVNGAVLNVTALNAPSAGYLTVFPCGTAAPVASSVNYERDATVPNMAIVGLGSQGDVCVYASSAADILVDVTGYFAPTGQTLIAVTGIRAVDTRPTGTKLLANIPRTLPYPIVNTSLVASVVITEAAAPGYATVYACDGAPPEASNLNFTAGVNVANTAFVRIAPAGGYCIVSTQDAHVIVDWTGFASSAQPRSPAD
jgi:hypothetical protein